uniref:Ig-like domain-containing protein n=1 Tax=Oryzias latipes TaxID=8090 RepID=A0A3P9MFG5_ORYLA
KNLPTQFYVFMILLILCLFYNQQYELVQDDLTLTGRVGQYITFSCGLVEQCYPDYVLWWQKKETETFKKIVHFYGRDCKIKKDYGHPQEEDFLSKKTLSGCELKINRLKVDHSYSIFGPGTRLFVTVKPVVSVYPAASRVHVEGSSSLLCLASAMFPPVVQFSWKRQKNNGPLEDLTSEEQLDLRESGRSASILLLHQQEDSSYKYICSVKHEGGTVEAQTQQGNEGLVTVFNRDSAFCGDAVI